VNVARTGLSKTQIQQAARQAITGIQYTYSGPLPHPEILEHYDRIVPGGAERIFTQFESQAKHRQSIESRVIRSNSFAQIFGAISAFILGLLAIGGGLFLVYVGKSLEGFGVFFTGLSSLVGVYIYGKKTQGEERKSKQS
jgi:uncharacterized membrane protein